MKIPTAWLSIADQITVLVLIPILDSFIYPILLKRFKTVFQENTRMMVGMCLSAISVIIAGLIESERLMIIHEDPVQNTIAQIIDNTTYYAADFNILWQLPQYTLIGQQWYYFHLFIILLSELLNNHYNTKIILKCSSFIKYLIIISLNKLF